MTDKYKKDAEGYYLERPDSHDLSIYDEKYKLWKEGDPVKGIKPRRPNWPWVCMGCIKRERNNPSVERYYPELFLLNVGTIHGTVNDLQRYLDRGFVVLDWFIPVDRLPRPLQKDDGVFLTHGWGVEFKSKEGQMRIKELIAKLEVEKNGVAKIYQQQEQIISLEAKLAKKEAELAEKGRSHAK